ncbi:hypothetical protein ACFVUS_20685 [Nocardia sp. NPDC058058]|uniref:hypothetical protein n=1 Tax=Nocardia sp. NPDC058058 TaxID=3346317 RepID=UPI0036DAC22F
MSYPYGPPENPGQGQPTSGWGQPEYPPQVYSQPAYPQPGYAQTGYPQTGYPQAGSAYPQGYPALPPSGGTAITAGVLSMIVGILAGLAALIMFAAGMDFSSRRRNRSYSYYDSDYDDLAGFMMIFSVIVAVMAVLWILGAILLFMRKTAGRVILIVLSGICVVGNLLGMVKSPGGAIIGLLLAGVILALAAVPPTGRWIAAGKIPPPAVPGYMPYPYA